MKKMQAIKISLVSNMLFIGSTLIAQANELALQRVAIYNAQDACKTTEIVSIQTSPVDCLQQPRDLAVAFDPEGFDPQVVEPRFFLLPPGRPTSQDRAPSQSVAGYG